MMELVYLWVEEYKNIHRQGFNFVPKFNCHYDEIKKYFYRIRTAIMLHTISCNIIDNTQVTLNRHASYEQSLELGTCLVQHSSNDKHDTNIGSFNES